MDLLNNFLCFKLLYKSAQSVSTDAERNLLLYMIGVLLLVSGLIITFFVVFQRRKNTLLLERLEQQKQFDEELVKTQQEIQDETFKQVGRELHDNIGQLLALTSMQLNLVRSNAEEATKVKLESAVELLKASISELRALSRSLNSDVIKNFTLVNSLKNEVNRLNKLGIVTINFEVIGDSVPLNRAQDRVMLFRIMQEFVSNTLKYSEASELNIVLDYRDSDLSVVIDDNGLGFDLEAAAKGSGLINMEKRAALINAKFQLTSRLGKGTRLTLTYPYIL